MNKKFLLLSMLTIVALQTECAEAATELVLKTSDPVSTHFFEEKKCNINPSC